MTIGQPNQEAVIVTEAEKCGAVSADAIGCLAIRSPLNCAIYKVVRGHVMGNMADADDPSCPYPLVDLMSNPAPADIGTGEMEMVTLVDNIAEAVAFYADEAVRAERERKRRLEAALRVARGYVLNVVEAEGAQWNRTDLATIDAALAIRNPHTTGRSEG